MNELDKLKNSVAANRSVIGSAISLLQAIKGALDQAGTDPVALKALSDSLGKDDADLAAAILANTPTPPGQQTGATTTTLVSSMNPAAVGAQVTLSARVAGQNAGGTVAFLDGTTSLGVGALTGGAAELVTTFADAGTHTLTAEYSGDVANAASVSDALSQSIG